MMTLRDKLRPFKKHIKLITILGGGILTSVTLYRKTLYSIQRIVNTSVMEREKATAEYIYVDDPSYQQHALKERSRESQQGSGFARLWKNVKHSFVWRLLWVCRHGSAEQRNIALVQLASFQKNREWDCLKVAQALDKDTAVLLARTEGADVRYFLPPPIHIRRAAGSPELLSYKFRDLLTAIQSLHEHPCVANFLEKHFANLQEQITEADMIPTKPDNISDCQLCVKCLDVIYHHLSVFYNKNYNENQSASTLINMGLLGLTAELLMRYPNDAEVDQALLKMFKLLSVHSNLLKDFFENGLIKMLARIIKSKDARLSSSAAVCLANLSGEACYGPGLYLLYPLYRTTATLACDTLLVHGLRGGVFVTWRQRDESCVKPLGIVEATVQEDQDCCEPPTVNKTLPDPELRQVMEDIMEMEDESLLMDLEVVLQDLPLNAFREEKSIGNFLASNKRAALIQEDEDKCQYSYCWPKDWLPKDCANLRILGVNYWSNLSEWLESCQLQNFDINGRAGKLIPVLVDADVGQKRPVVWLSHSMGGLIVKQLLVSSSQSDDDKLKNICKNTKALLFYSTPHKGSALAKMPRAAAAIFWPSTDVRQLEENSPSLLKLHEDFNKLSDHNNWHTISFAETKPTLVSAFKVPVHFVPISSADLGRGTFYEMPLDHLTICKPASRQSVLYTTVINILESITANEAAQSYNASLLDWIMEWFMLLTSYLVEILSVDKSSSSVTNTPTRWFGKFYAYKFSDDDK